MLEHLKMKHSAGGGAGFTLDLVVRRSAAGCCNGVRVTPWSMCVICWEPPLISLQIVFVCCVPSVVFIHAKLRCPSEHLFM